MTHLEMIAATHDDPRTCRCRGLLSCDPPGLKLLGGIVLDEGLVPCDRGSVLVDARDLENDVVVPMLAFAASAFRSPNLLLVVRQQVGLQIQSLNRN